MKLGYLHLGGPRHGIERYGRMLAAEARRRSDLEVVEIGLSAQELAIDACLIGAARTLSEADVVHVQYNAAVWGGGALHQERLETFLRNCRSRLLATAHDVYPRSLATIGLVDRLGLGRWGPGRKLLEVLDRFPPPGPVEPGWRILLDGTEQVVVSFEEERRRLERFGASRGVVVVPLFVERRPDLPRDAKSRLGLEGRVFTLLGFIHKRKGYSIVPRALAALPSDVTVVFAGDTVPGSEGYLESILREARTLGVDSRIRVTGYLTEEELELYLAATDLAICPFQRLSASASLATWLSVGCSTLCTDLPQVREYNRLVPNAIHSFSPYTSAALARAAGGILARGDIGVRQPARELGAMLSIALMFDRYMTVYRQLLS
jgi:glycosyltransferase involved in cell wall biosynthesis